MSSRSDEFYVGYAREAPRALGERTRLVAIALLVAAAFAGVVLTISQHEYGPGVFEYGIERAFNGRIELVPFPILLVPRDGAAVGGSRFSRYLLAAPGKFGARDLLAPFSGTWVRLRGTLAYREGRTLVEVVPGSVQASSTSTRYQDETVSLGVVTLAGEIVDSKCFLGVMNPARAKPHRGCAVRCLSGGIPPLFVASDAGGGTAQMLLIGSDGRALNREILDFVAEPVKITGDLSRMGDLLILRAEPRSIERISQGDRR